MQYPLFYNSINDDRPYDADSFADWLKKFFTTGVFKDELQVSAVSGMGISVSAGYANINGKVMMFETTPLTIGTADGTYYRIDSVIIERNDTDRQFYIKVVQGNTGTEDSVQGVTPVRSGAVYQLVIARIKVRPGATAITQADITDTRADSVLCGIVAGTVDAMDFDQFKAQFDSYFDAFKTGQQADFESWFANIQDVLDEDTAGHLQNEIDALDDDKVGKAGDTLNGDLIIDKTGTSDAPRVRLVSDDAIGELVASPSGNFGLYDTRNQSEKCLIRTDGSGNIHSDITANLIWSSKSYCSSVSTSYTYFQRAGIASWRMILIKFTVHEHVEMLLFVRGENQERSLTDWPAAGKFRGCIYVDWANSRIGLRCINAGAQNNHPDLVYFDYVYGVL
jgi:hypothetical protein